MFIRWNGLNCRNRRLETVVVEVKDVVRIVKVNVRVITVLTERGLPHSEVRLIIFNKYYGILIFIYMLCDALKISSTVQQIYNSFFIVTR